MSRITNRPPIVFGAERVLLGVQIDDQFVVFDSNNPHHSPGILISIAPAGATSNDLDDALHGGTSVRNGRRVLEAQEECGIGLHEFQTFGNTADLDAVRTALPHFLEVSTDPALRETLEEIGQHLGISGPDGPDEDDLDDCVCPNCYGDAFRRKGSTNNFVCAVCQHRFPFSERATLRPGIGLV